MAWRNAFDIGACDVTLFFGNHIQLFEGTLAKGQSSPVIDFSTAGVAGLTGVVSVDQNGVVSLSLSTPGSGSGWGAQINVTPSYAHDLPSRISGFQGVGDMDMLVATINNVNPQMKDVDFVGYGNQLPPPDPVDMSSLTGERDLIGAYYAVVAA